MALVYKAGFEMPSSLHARKGEHMCSVVSRQRGVTSWTCTEMKRKMKREGCAMLQGHVSIATYMGVMLLHILENLDLIE